MSRRDGGGSTVSDVTTAERAPRPTRSHASELRCVFCGTAYPLGPFWSGCPTCIRDDFVYPVAVEYATEGMDVRAVPNKGDGIWRWEALLPPVTQHVTLNEGNTPVVECPTLAALSGVRRFLVKDESRNPTWAHKDRAMAAGVSDAKSRGASVVTISSSGNAAISAAAYASRAGLSCVVFLSDTAPVISRSVVQRLGAVAVATSLEGRWRLMEQCVRQYGWYPLGGWTSNAYTGNPYAIDGYKTIAFELWEQLGDALPDAIVVPTAGAEVIFAIHRGFSDLQRLGLVSRVPRLVAAEPAVGAPMYRALLRDLDWIPPVPHASTVATSIGASIGSYRGIVAVRGSAGAAVAVTEDEILAAYDVLAKREGLFVEPSAAASIAGGMQIARSGFVDGEASVLCISSSGGLKDPAVAAAGLVDVPVIEPDFDTFQRVLRDTYGMTFQ